jgi:hypothetical protein
MNNHTMERAAFETSSVMLFIVATATTLRTIKPAHSAVDNASFHISIFTSMLSSLHYALMGLYHSHRARVIFRCIDWLITVPLMRLQLCAQLRVNDARVVKAVYGFTFVAMILVILAEVVSSLFYLRFVCVSGAVAAARESIIAQERCPPGKPNFFLRGIMLVYACIFFAGMLHPAIDNMTDVLYAVADTGVKTVFVIYSITHPLPPE